MNRSLDSVLDSLLSEMNRLDNSSLVGDSQASSNTRRGESGSEVLSTQHHVGAEITRYNNLVAGSRQSLEAQSNEGLDFHEMGALDNSKPGLGISSGLMGRRSVLTPQSEGN